MVAVMTCIKPMAIRKACGIIFREKRMYADANKKLVFAAIEIIEDKL
jgi:hypothetical protein